MYQLAGLLPDDSKRYERTSRVHAGLFLELSASRCEQILPGFGNTFRDGPRARVASLPEGTARVGQEEL